MMNQSSRFAILLLLAAGCTSAGSDPPGFVVVLRTALHDFRVEAVADGLVRPFSMAFTPEGDLLVTERPGRLRIIRDGVLLPDSVEGLAADPGTRARCPFHERLRAGRTARRDPSSGVRDEPAPLSQLREAGAGFAGHDRHRPGPVRERPADGCRGTLPRGRVRQRYRPKLHVGRAPRLRPRRLPVHDAGRPAVAIGGRPGGAPGPGSVEPQREHHPAPRRRPGPGGQPVGGPDGGPPRDLDVGPPQCAGDGGAPGDGGPVAERARPAGRG